MHGRCAQLLRIYALGYALGSRSVCALCTVALILYCPFRLREGRTSQVGQGVRFRSVGWVRVPSWRGWGRNSGKGFNNPVKKRGALRVRYTRTYTYAHTHTIAFSLVRSSLPPSPHCSLPPRPPPPTRSDTEDPPASRTAEATRFLAFKRKA